VVQPHEIRPRSSNDPHVDSGSTAPVNWLMWRLITLAETSPAGVFFFFFALHARLCNPFLHCAIPSDSCYLRGVCHACMLLDRTVVITINKCPWSNCRSVSLLSMGLSVRAVFQLARIFSFNLKWACLMVLCPSWQPATLFLNIFFSWKKIYEELIVEKEMSLLHAFENFGWYRWQSS
jgi:hypothetical protein